MNDIHSIIDEVVLNTISECLKIGGYKGMSALFASEIPKIRRALEIYEWIVGTAKNCKECGCETCQYAC
jgi:hypothetical protein